MSYGTVQAEKMTTESGYSLGAGNASSFKNRLINGNMTIDQRNSGNSTTPASTGAVYTLDRWYLFSLPAASKFSVQQVSAPSGFTGLTKAALITTTSAIAGASGDVYAFDQAIEGYNIADLGWGAVGAKSITISFWAQASITGTYSVAILASGGNASYATTVSLTANTPTYCSVTIPGPTIGTYGTTNNTGFYVIFDMGSGSSVESPTPNAWYAGNAPCVAGSVKLVRNSGATFYVSGVQLEVGTVATSFDFRSIGTELALCQRYLYAVRGSTALNNQTAIGVGCWDGISGAAIVVPFPVQLRAYPSSITVSSAADFQIVREAVSWENATAIVLQTDGAGTQAAGILVSTATRDTRGYAARMRSNSASAYLGFNSEL